MLLELYPLIHCNHMRGLYMTFSRKRLKFDEERLTHESTGIDHMQLIDTGVYCVLDLASIDIIA